MNIYINSLQITAPYAFSGANFFYNSLVENCHFANTTNANTGPAPMDICLSDSEEKELSHLLQASNTLERKEWVSKKVVALTHGKCENLTPFLKEVLKGTINSYSHLLQTNHHLSTALITYAKKNSNNLSFLQRTSLETSLISLVRQFTKDEDLISKALQEVKGDIKKIPELYLKAFQLAGKTVKNLDLSNTRISSSTINLLVELFPNIRHFSAQNAEISDDETRYLAKFDRLQTINLSGCKHISDETLKNLKNASELKELTISSCPRISDVGLLIFCEHHQLFQEKHMKTLRRIDARNCPEISANVIEILSNIEGFEFFSGTANDRY